MTVYVDDFMIPFGRMKMSHMIADTHEELIAMADRIGVDRRWLQHEGDGPSREHFDIAISKREAAIAIGAVPVTCDDLARWRINRRAAKEGR